VRTVKYGCVNPLAFLQRRDVSHSYTIDTAASRTGLTIGLGSIEYTPMPRVEQCMNAVAIVVSAASARVFNVLLGNRARVDAALANLAKRAARKGLVPLTWSWGKAFTQRQHVALEMPCDSHMGLRCRGCTNVTRVPLTIEGEPPHYAGWTFIAARHDDGRAMQVGSTCIGDFLGSHDAEALAAAASMFAAARGLAEEGEEGFGGGGSGDCSLAEFLSIVASCVREQGWVSRTAAREQGGNATADRAITYMGDRKLAKEAGCEPTAEDIDAAAAAEAWAEALTDGEVDAAKGDYLHNLRAVARSGIVGHKSAGIAASTVIAHQRAIGRERQRAERAARPMADVWLGEVGKRETWAVALDFVTGYESAYGYTTVLKFRTAEGATLTWKASRTDLTREDVGKTYALTGTVKKHDEYKGSKQTIVSRCRCEAVNAENAPPSDGAEVA
jgi:hypothetical protein